MDQYIKMLTKTPIFSGVNETEISAMLQCLMAVKKFYGKGSYIFQSGDKTSSMGLMLSGSALLVQEDLWGRRNIITKINPGDSFAEAYASSPGTVLNVSVVADKNCEVLLLDVNKVMTVCPSACQHHNRVVANLVSALAKKALLLNEKITHVSKHSTKEKILSYLSSRSMEKGSLTFDIPFDRQQLADYLCVDRAAMSVELSKLQKSGVISYQKNHFILNVNGLSDTLL